MSDQHEAVPQQRLQHRVLSRSIEKTSGRSDDVEAVGACPVRDVDDAILRYVESKPDQENGRYIDRNEPTSLRVDADARLAGAIRFDRRDIECVAGGLRVRQS